ncbi:MAG: FAD-dependent oxidoreductase [Clostridium sp.]|nr:FAD-dependent oxidoreductase [Clostridium sp.]
MHMVKLRDDFYWTGVTDESLRVFDIIMYTEFGTTYNSYVLKAGDKTVLFETAKAKFFEDYVEKLKEIVDVHSIDYLVVSHTEPDHAGSVEKLLELSPQMKILATGCAIGFLKEIVNRDFVSIPVKDRQRMEIGNKTLQFLIVPNLHWPDTMYTFIEEEQILVTCDSFGSHYAHSGVLASTVPSQEDYLKAAKYYYDCIIGPFKPFMLKALNRVKTMDISMICTGHGPVLDTTDSIKTIMQKYEEWSTVVNPNPKKTVIIPYVSAYGYTKELAEKIAEGVKDSGDIDVRSYDMVEADKAAVEQELLFADGILFGTPTILGEALAPIWNLTLSMFAGTHGGKFAGAFGSYGWSGEGVPHILERLKQLRMKVDDGFRVRFKPSRSDLVGAYEYGYQFGCRVLNIEACRPKKTGARTLVKCLVCGEIFDSSLEICPVCGVGKENFVPADIEENSFSNNTKEYYIILGNGIAGLNAAKAIRERDKTGTVVMISNESCSSYNRPMLTKTMLASLTAEQIAVEPESWYEENNICQILGRTVVSVDTEKLEVLLDDGSQIHFTRLIYALGSECFIPPIPGSDREQVIAVRRINDVEKISSLLKISKNAVVIGGGVLGLEAAWELKKAGLSVTVLEAAPMLMGRQLDATAGSILEEISRRNGIAIHTGVSISSIDGDETGAVSSVSLVSGETFPADLVIVSAGVRANTGLAQEMGLKTEKAVVVNSHMETGINHIYACGDCAEYKGANFAIWPEASEQGRVAGANAAGDELEYRPVSSALTFNGMNTSLYAAGDNGKNPNLLYKTVEFKDMGKEQYKKFYFLNNRLCGVILIGDLSQMAKMAEALEQHASYKEVVK